MFDAIQASDINKVKDILAKGLDPNVSRSDGLKFLHVAAISRNVEVLEHLLKQHNIQCDVLDNDGNTPLHLAAKHGDFEAVKSLLAFGASATITNNIGKKAVDYATDSTIQSYLNEHMNNNARDKQAQKVRAEFLKEMESHLPTDIPVLKSFAIEFLLANQLFQKRCKEAIYILVKDKHDAMYRRKNLEKKAGIVDTETSATFIDNLQKIEEENELQAATIARLKIQNHMLEQQSNSKSEWFRRNLNESSDQVTQQITAATEAYLKSEANFLNGVAELTAQDMILRNANADLISGVLAKKSMRESDLQFLKSVQNENSLLQTNIFEIETEIVALNERLKVTELLSTIYEKDRVKLKNDNAALRKAIQDKMAKAFTEARTEADDKEEESGQIQFVKAEGGKKQVKAATLEKLLDRLSDPSTYDSQFQTTFLLTFRVFTDGHTVLGYMMKRYKDTMVTNTSNPASQTASVPVRQRICLTIRDWIESFWYDFTSDKTLLAKVQEFVDYVMRHNNKLGSLIKLPLIKKLSEKEDPIGERPKDMPAPPKPILPRVLMRKASETDDGSAPTRVDRAPSMTAWNAFTFGKSKSSDDKQDEPELKFYDIDPLEVARQLTLMEFRFFSEIKPNEFLDQAWNKDDKEVRAPNICALSKWEYQVTQWLVSEIVSVKDTKVRSVIYEKVIMVAHSLETLHNFNGVKEVLNALDNQVIKNLQKTRELVPAKTLKIHEELSKLTNSHLNYKHLRAKIHNSNLPLIPYPGIYQHDLAQIDNSGKNELPDRMINFSKFQKLATYILELQTYQQNPYNFELVPEIAEYIRGYDVLSEANVARFGNHIEPKLN